MPSEEKTAFAQWEGLIREALSAMKTSFNGVPIEIDNKILSETIHRIVEHIGFHKAPNIAKQAGIALYWIQKLKPVFVTTALAKNKNNPHLTLANEHMALLVALSACGLNVGQPEAQAPSHEGSITVEGLPPEFILQWVKSLRYKPHSRYSLIIALELFMCEDGSAEK